MAQLFYAVTATLPKEIARDYLLWLKGGHVKDVLHCGAQRAQIVVLDSEDAGATIRIETQYVFTTRQAFDSYVAGPARLLRAEGLEKFPPERGIVFERRIGEVQ